MVDHGENSHKLKDIFLLTRFPSFVDNNRIETVEPGQTSKMKLFAKIIKIINSG